MQLFFVFFVLLFTSTRCSKIEAERDMLASLDVFAFGYSQQASQHWDCPQVSSRVEKAEEGRIWRAAIPDARIGEKTLADEHLKKQMVEVYRWEEIRILNNDFTMAKISSSIQNTATLGLRKPRLKESIDAKSVKILFSKSKYINKRALSAMLPQLERVKNRIMEQMAIYQVYPFSPMMVPKAPGPIVDRHLRVPKAENYHPRVFRDAHFTTADLVALMVVFARFSFKKPDEVSELFNAMVRVFLPGSILTADAVPRSSTGRPTKTIYLCHSYQYIPAGVDHAFYFDGNCGRFLSLSHDSIVLDRPEGIVDGQQHEAKILILDANVKASSLTMRQANAKRDFCELLESKLALSAPAEATDAEVQAYWASQIRSLATRS